MNNNIIIIIIIIIITVLLTEYCGGGKIEKNEMGGVCSAYGAGEGGVQGSGGETWGKETIGETQTHMGG